MLRWNIFDNPHALQVLIYCMHFHFLVLVSSSFHFEYLLTSIRQTFSMSICFKEVNRTVFIGSLLNLIWSLDLINIFISLPFSWKGFVLKSKPTRNEDKLVILKGTIRLYSPCRSCLFMMSMMVERTSNGPSPKWSHFKCFCIWNLFLLLSDQLQPPGSKKKSLATSNLLFSMLAHLPFYT